MHQTSSPFLVKRHPLASARRRKKRKIEGKKRKPDRPCSKRSSIWPSALFLRVCRRARRAKEEGGKRTQSSKGEWPGQHRRNRRRLRRRSGVGVLSAGGRSQKGKMKGGKKGGKNVLSGKGDNSVIRLPYDFRPPSSQKKEGKRGNRD